MKLLAGETVVKVEFSEALRPRESLAVAAILYLVARASGASGFQLRPSGEIVPVTGTPLVTAVMVTSVRVPSATVTCTPLVMLTLSAPVFGEIVIFASEASFAAAASTCACEVAFGV